MCDLLGGGGAVSFSESSSHVIETGATSVCANSLGSLAAEPSASTGVKEEGRKVSDWLIQK